LDNLHRLGDLRVRGRKQAGDLLGHGLVRRKPGKLGLPQVEVAPGQLVEFGASSFNLVVVSGGHAHTITHRIAASRLCCLRRSKARLVALRHRR
jgi:hypothetical protein